MCCNIRAIINRVEPHFCASTGEIAPITLGECPANRDTFSRTSRSNVIARGVDRQAVFFQPQDYTLYLQALRDAAVNCRCQVHAYVLMTNHVHLLVTPEQKRSLPLMMQAMGRTYVQRLNVRYQRTGTLWEGRYKASLVQTEWYLLACQRYIELNPVRAGMVAAPGEYAYSSYACHCAGKGRPAADPACCLFGSARRSGRQTARLSHSVQRRTQ
jgi:REP element-mobilizing transposase RayT